MDKKELKRQVAEMKIEGGAYQIRNTTNGKVFVDVTPNFRTLNGRKMMLANRTHVNTALQAEVQEFGPDAFVFEILETLAKPETGYFDERDELNKLEQKWLKQLQPFGERGYNRPTQLKD